VKRKPSGGFFMSSLLQPTSARLSLLQCIGAMQMNEHVFSMPPALLLAGDLQAAILEHMEAVARKEDLGGGAPRDEHEEDNNNSFARLSRWLR
jgi:hypothetical protein